MRRWWLSPWLWLAFYLAILSAIAVGMIVTRNRVLLDDQEHPARHDKVVRDWDKWREEAAKQDGRSGPVQRAIPPTDEPPMLIMMRDHFPVLFVASIVFPAVILGFFLAVGHGVLRQSNEPKQADSEPGETQ